VSAAGGGNGASHTDALHADALHADGPQADAPQVDGAHASARRGGQCEPSTLVVFGATGDLARRKILPALWRLHARGVTAAGCAIVGTSRDLGVDDARFRALAVESVRAVHTSADEAAVRAWADRWLHFQAAAKDLAPLLTRVEEVERALELSGNRSFYLSLPPAAFPQTVEHLGSCGLTKGPGWKRLVIEKPFGRDLASARELNALVHRHFDEDEVYRIDHYLGKETVQNLLVFRFANAMFESVWDRDHVESVMITVAEELGVEERAGYYETAGALRDMVQSHLTQLMTLVAMEVPAAMDAASIRAEKLKVLRSVRPLAPDDAVLGQYEPGRVDEPGGRARDVPGYREEPGVAPDSRTETFVALALHVENWRWQGVPFYLRTGKRMPRRLTEIEIKFRRAPVWMFRAGAASPEGPGTELHRNTLLMTLQPDEGFSLYFDVKAPGDPFRIRRLPLHFRYAEEFDDDLPEAYETLVRDVLAGDQTLFVHAAEVEASWALYAPLLDGRRAVYPYPAGSWGPNEAARLSSRSPGTTTPMGGV
jgi:glucose-6-phosphate 1-dehydrogenase